MSEFSFSYHVAGVGTQEVCERLHAARVPAYVFDAARGWTTFVLEPDPYILDLIADELLALFDERLLAYAFAGDHGLWLQVYEDGDLVVDYELCWDCDTGPEVVECRCDDDDIDILRDIGREHGSRLNRKRLVSLLQEHDSVQRVLSALRAQPSFVDEIVSHLGIVHYDWLSFHYLELDLEGMASTHRGPCLVAYANDEPVGRPYR